MKSKTRKTPVLERWRLSVKYKWQDLGNVTQVMFVFAFIFGITFSFSTYSFISAHYENREIKCLAMNVYHEARGESQQGKLAVALVTMNRVKSSRYPDDVCRVVYQKAWNKKRERFVSAFSWTTDDIDDIPEESLAWKDAYSIAKQVYTQENIEHKAQDALFYHADYVRPYWAKTKKKIAKIGRHIFYK